MKNFMIEVALPKQPGDEFYSLIEQQRAHINGLLNEGTVTGYALAIDRSKLWITIDADTEAEVEGILQKFPMAKFFRWEIIELLFHNRTKFALPQLFMN